MPMPIRISVRGRGLHVIRLPQLYVARSQILHLVRMQLLAYYTATARGLEVGKPPNLATSVKVE